MTYWAQEGAQIGWLVSGSELVAPPIPFSFHQARRVRDADALRDALLAAGAPADGERIKVDDGARADITAMGTTALGAAAGTIPWPASYALGWITMSNTRIALPTPAAGLALAAAVGAWYAGIVQHARDIKDALLAAEDEAALDAVDIEAGWPD
ncbi:DUF4376 domain-containing protein [Ancylobacter amanitiformis]|uniref:DUF4376 domain-containing protein n=1 Tax=Ancylobacter amanitiformis TaxID=217069 RepID=A0ABU0LQ84_9HYPH|nr:DUF4376 domain-containing protein [Ancylobacter amanitiformis]MDQ0510875.1 hypothetical protein [Ancylobacter amanitiformis]